MDEKDSRRRGLDEHAKALLMDSAAWLAGVVIAMSSRYDFEPSTASVAGAASAAMVAVALHALIGHGRYLYRGRHQFGTFDEVRTVTTTVLATAMLVTTLDVALPQRLAPASSPLVGGLIALVLMLGGRYAYRLRAERRLRPRVASPALLFGAGAAGHHLVRAILHDRHSPYIPVGVLDDDPDKCHLRVYGVPVLGRGKDLAAVARKTGAATVIFAVANAEAALIRHVRRSTLEAGLAFKVVPSVAELLGGRISVANVRDAAISDLLGRRQVDIDLATLADRLTGRRVLVTGAGGSIGAELCRQVAAFAPAELVLLDRDESALHAVQLSLSGRALLDSPDVVLADVRDPDAMADVFATHRPQIVLHAAALKHLPLLERFPAEAVKTNIWGTQCLLDLAGEVELFVNISTDKAANPTSVLGYAKRITERLTAYAAMVNPGTFLNVRFGNVLGSRGSVLTAFTAQAASGGPITVTHPDVTRFLMTVQEAVQLVVQAASIGDDGEVLVLDIGSPVRIADLAHQVASEAPQPVDIVYTGLRPGEKLHEELFGHGEVDTRPRHPLISHVSVPPLDPAVVRGLDVTLDHPKLIQSLADLCAPPLILASHAQRSDATSRF